MLKVCCVPRAAFSEVESSDQAYRPSSDVTVMARRRLEEVEEEGLEEDVL